MNKSIDYESLFTYISLLLAFAIFIILMYGCLSNNYSNIENFTTTPAPATTAVDTEPVIAEIANITVNSTGGITSINLNSTAKGKYYKNEPPLITIMSPTDTTGEQAKAVAKLKSTTSQPENAEIISMAVNATGGITSITLKADKKGKYYKDKPPLITIAIPTATGSVQATATVVLNSAVIAGTTPELCEIASITIETAGSNYTTEDITKITFETIEAYKIRYPVITNTLLYEIDIIDITEEGKNYVVADSNKISIETIADYKLRTNPIITLTDEQKQNITTLINGCSALNNKQSYITKITSNNLRKQDVDSIISEVSKSS
jgi:hypothetical protein